MRAGISLTIDGLDELQAALKKAPRKTRALLGDVIETSAEVVARVGRVNAPRDKGDLAHAIDYDGRGVSWRAGIRSESLLSRRRGQSTDQTHLNPSIYGRMVEYGTGHTTAQPFMRPAAEAERGRLPQRLVAMAAKLPKAVA